LALVALSLGALVWIPSASLANPGLEEWSGEYRLQQRDTKGGRARVRVTFSPEEDTISVTHEIVSETGELLRRSIGEGRVDAESLNVRFSPRKGIAQSLSSEDDEPLPILGSIEYRRLSGGRLQGRGKIRVGDEFRLVEERGRLAPDPATPPSPPQEPSEELVSVTVLDAYAFSDQGRTHWERGSEVTRPAAIVKDAKLRLSPTFAGSPPEGLRARIGDYELERDEAGAFVSPLPVSASVGTRNLPVTWFVGEREIAKSPLRIHITYAKPLLSQLEARHLENACFWGRDAKSNDGSKRGVSYRIAHQLSHFVHPAEHPSERLVLDYEPGAPVPANYDLLDGDVLEGRRKPEFLYYPPFRPLEPRQDLKNYRSNYGWRVLDNPDYPGGRCDMQASLLASVLQSVGIEARVHVVQRRARGKTSGRPMRQYFKGPQRWEERLSIEPNSLGWNFHAITEVVLDDGSSWYVDLAFFTEPGTLRRVESEGGPIVRRWTRWLYDDRMEHVPDYDLPDTSSD
jgi:transglutaminase superfamily protein